jgi:hypothetical protein
MRKKTEKKPASYLDVTSIRIDSLNLNLSSFVKYMQRRARARREPQSPLERHLLHRRAFPSTMSIEKRYA